MNRIDQTTAALEAQLREKRASAYVLRTSLDSLDMEIRALANTLAGLKAASEPAEDAPGSQ